ncbi:MAG: cupredoxin family copper-binding protein [Chloroflexota bacterium]|nr:cupredoxin family copper-binding protein [Chloroflexota bacterium]
MHITRRSRGFGRNRVAVAALFALLLTSLVAVGNATSVSADVSVNIVNLTFNPMSLTIPVGTTIVWTNQDTAGHTTTSDTGVWDSGLAMPLKKGDTFKFTFNQVGTFPYHCMIHAFMTGTIVVTAASAAPSVAPPAGGLQAFANPAFQQLWAQTDANPSGHSYIWGPGPFTPPGLMEDYKDAPGGKRLVQYFDKARMELNAPGGPVTAGLLSVELISGQQQNGDATFVQRDPARVTVAGDPDNPFPTYADLAKLQGAEQDNSGSGVPVAKMVNPTGPAGTYAPAMTDTLAKTTGYDAQTRHNIPKAFLDFRNSPNLGGIQAIGLAITEPVWANVKVNNNVVPVLVQAFERRVLTYTPDNPILFRVEYGNIGRAYYAWRSATPSAAPAPPAAVPAAAPSAPGNGGSQPGEPTGKPSY